MGGSVRLVGPLITVAVPPPAWPVWCALRPAKTLLRVKTLSRESFAHTRDQGRERRSLNPCYSLCCPTTFRLASVVSALITDHATKQHAPHVILVTKPSTSPHLSADAFPRNASHRGGVKRLA